MALITCPECTHKVSDTATFCPNCGYRFDRKRKNNFPKKKRTPTKDCKPNPKVKKFSNTLEYIFRLEWVEDISDWLYCIPVIGGFLSILFVIIAVLVALGIVIFVVGTIIEHFFEIVPALVIAVGILALNVFNWFVCYRTHNRKEWFFWIGLLFSIVFGIPLIIAVATFI